VDLRQGFIDLGYDLFLDRGTLSTTFIVANVFDISKLKEAVGRVDVIHVGSFLHLFSWEKQREASSQISKLLKRSVGSLIVGNQVGSTEPGEHLLKAGSAETMFRHNKSSFEKLWSEVGYDFGVEWRIVFEFLAEQMSPSSDEGAEQYQDRSAGKRFIFSIELVSFENKECK
jgi:hypothetical protein